MASDQGANETLVVACIDFNSSQVAASPSGTPLAILTSPTCSPQLTCMALVDLHCGIFSGIEGVMGFLLLLIAGLPSFPFLTEV